MDLVRFGSGVRAIRHRRGWTQSEVARRSGVSQAAISRLERGDGATLPARVIEAIATALGARATLRLSWHGEDLDRLLDAAHAGLVDQVVALLRANGWEVVPEVTFNLWGERGSIDVLAYHSGRGALLVVEVKSTVPDMQAMLASLDRKVRLAPSLARERGWAVRHVVRLLVLPADRTSRRRIDAHAATVNQLMPARTVAVRRWLRDPRSALGGGVMFLPDPRSVTSRQRIRTKTP